MPNLRGTSLVDRDGGGNLYAARAGDRAGCEGNIVDSRGSLTRGGAIQ